ERQALVRLTAPVPGMLNVFAYGEDEGTATGTATAGVRAYLFSPDAADYVRREEPAWEAWLRGLPVSMSD
ncbi:MAG: SRPBCC domain-containing protein, partial [Propionibacteriaceae bacterium]|nr:SRPBCC domain-containing protein [Propionibacteriaceae bacterium]